MGIRALSSLVTDSDLRQVLAIIRSLGKKGVMVTAGCCKSFSIGFFSRYCNKKLLYPSPDKHPELFKKMLLKHIAKNKTDVLIPISHSAQFCVSRSLSSFVRYTSVPIPPYESLVKALDKALTIETADTIPHPKTFIPKKISEVHSIAKEINYPTVIKPRTSSGSRGLRYASNRAELIYHFKATAEKYDMPIVQEYIPGDEIYGVSALFNRESEARAFFVHKRIRQFPITGGPSTLRISVWKPALVKLGLKLLEKMRWYGVAMVEFKIDPRDNKPKLIEVNPRFWGSLNLAIASGVDFPYLFYKMAVDGDVQPVYTYRVGVRARFLLFGDIFHFIASPNKLGLLPEFLKLYNKGLSYDICRWDDPLPAIVRALNGLRYVFSRGMWEYMYFRT